MTSDVTPDRRGSSLGLRLTVAFVGVALLSITLVTAAALVGTDRGLSTLTNQGRDGVSADVATSLSSAYENGGGWAGADLSEAIALAETAGASLLVLDDDGDVLVSTAGGGMGPAGGNGPGHGPGHGADVADGLTAPVAVDGAVVGSYRLVFRTSAYSLARGIAWWWIVGAAAVALVVAVAAAYLVSTRVSRPLTQVAATARRFAAGDRSARTEVDAVGELGDVARALNEMADEVVVAERSRQRAASDVAHELRTPLASLRAGLEEIRDGLVGPDPEALSRLHDQTLRLGRIVEDLSELSAAERGSLRLQRQLIDLVALVREQVAAEQPRLRASDMSIDLEVPQQPIPVEGDPVRLAQVIGNLLSNAARYCRAGDTVTVAVASHGDEALLTVTDTGPGIAADELPHVFDRLWRGQGADRVGGSGIGLAVVRELVTAHGGRVEATSDGHHGTQIAVTLPLATTGPCA